MKRFTYLLAALLSACGGGSDKDDCTAAGGTLVTQQGQTACVQTNPLPPLPERQGG